MPADVVDVLMFGVVVVVVFAVELGSQVDHSELYGCFWYGLV